MNMSVATFVTGDVALSVANSDFSLNNLSFLCVCDYCFSLRRRRSSLRLSVTANMSEGCSSDNQHVQIDHKGSAPLSDECEPAEGMNYMPYVSWSMVPEETQVSWWNLYKKSHRSEETQFPKTMHKVLKHKDSARNSTLKPNWMQERRWTKCSENLEENFEQANSGASGDEDSHSVSMNVSWVEGDEAHSIQHQQEAYYNSVKDRLRNELMEDLKDVMTNAMMRGMEIGIRNTLRERVVTEMAELEARLMEKLMKSDEIVEKLMGQYSSFLEQMNELLPRFVLR